MTLGEFFEFAVRRELGGGHSVDHGEGIELPVSPSGGYLPGVELSTRGLLDAAEAAEAAP